MSAGNDVRCNLAILLVLCDLEGNSDKILFLNMDGNQPCIQPLTRTQRRQQQRKLKKQYLKISEPSLEKTDVNNLEEESSKVQIIPQCSEDYCIIQNKTEESEIVAKLSKGQKKRLRKKKTSVENSSRFCDQLEKSCIEPRAQSTDVIIETANSYLPDHNESSFIKYVNDDCVIEFSTDKLSKPLIDKNEPCKSEIEMKENSEKTGINMNKEENIPQAQTKTNQELKAERKAIFLAKRAAELEKKKSESEKKETSNDTNSAEKAPKKGAEKSKAELKAERRKLQEMQRVAKTTNKLEKGKESTHKPKNEVPTTKPATDTNKKPVTVVNKGSDVNKHDSKIPKKSAGAPEKSFRKIPLFSHLPQFEKNSSYEEKAQIPDTPMYAIVKEIGLQMSRGIIVGSNARCLALLGVVKEVIEKYKTPPGAEMSKDLDSCLDACYAYLNSCRPLNVCMSIAAKHLKQEIKRIPSDMQEQDAKKCLYDSIDSFVQMNIVNAQKLISAMASAKIQDGDVILTYACSTAVKQAILHAHNEGKKFRVIVADGRPKKEGEKMLRFLKKNQINCSYILITSIANVMCEVNSVMMGAHSLHTNGAVMSRVGTSQIALIAKAFNIPVIICCETYKCCEHVSVDSFVYNELGYSSDMICSVPGKGDILENWKEINSLYLLNITYDVTPPQLVTVIITEKGMLPCSSVPVVLRVKEIQESVATVAVHA
ncbi:Translation initiation factor eIF-2B subunit delta [Nymphon striatum]|nr:Translation initiation factor eIF-2B subunit delta [Nymphon striatum]